MFFKGALMQDPSGALINPGEETSAGRQLRFTSVEEMLAREMEIRDFIAEAIRVERAGAKLPTAASRKLELPAELLARFKRQPALKTAFEALTPGRQRNYQLHFSQAKQSSTRLARIERHARNILHGYGIGDCTCGLSARGLSCDGSHKYLDGNGEDTRVR